MAGIKYSEDGKFLVFSNVGNKEETVPVTLIDELLERNISFRLSELISFRAMTGVSDKDNTPPDFMEVPISQLVGADLVGKTCSVYFSNWEDSEWLHTDEAVTVESAGNDSFAFVFNEENSMNRFNLLESVHFSGHEKVIVKPSL